MADDQQAPETPDETPEPADPQADATASAEGGAGEAADTRDATGSADAGAAEAADGETAERAVPSEEAAEIAGSAEDAPLEAFEEAGGAPPTPEAEQFEPVPGHAAPSEDAIEIAGVAEDAPLEASQDAGGGADGAAGAAQAAEERESTPAAAGAGAATAEGREGAPASPESGDDEDEEAPALREKPAVPGAHLELDIVPEGVDPLGRDREAADPYAAVAEVYEQEVVEDGADAQVQTEQKELSEETLSEPISTAAIDLAAGARYRATGKRKTAIARVTLRPGSGTYVVNGRTLEEHFPRGTLQRNIRQPLETVGYQERMDVIARLHGGGISAQAGALRHGVSRALLEADPNLRGELKRRGFLTRDSRAKERKKAGLKKARKRPQFSKR
jgi:small subunit ribosomal protein S9